MITPFASLDLILFLLILLFAILELARPLPARAGLVVILVVSVLGLIFSLAA